MLILPHTNGLRVNLHELCKRILQAVRDGNGAAQRQVVLRVLCRRKLRRGIDRRARLADNHVIDIKMIFAQRFVGEDLRFLRRRAVADGNERDAVLLDKPYERLFGFAHARLAVRGVNDAGVEHLARGIDDGDLAARAVAGVKADGHAAFDGRLHQKLTEVYGEHLNGVVARFFGQLRTNFPLDGRENETAVCVNCGFAYDFAARGIALYVSGDQNRLPAHVIHFERNF